MVENTSRQDAALAQLNATLASTGGVSGKTAEQLTSTASSLQKITRYGDEAIIEMQSLLLTFKDIKGDQFDETSKAVLDMATAMGTDLKSAAIQLGKALNDPAKNLSALSRSGITFSESQAETIKQMQAMGDMAGAQTLILAELESQFGGSAEAARDTLGGALEGLGNAWGDLFEAQGDATGGMVESLNTLEEAITDPAFVDGMQTLLGSLAEIGSVAASAALGIVNLGTAIGENLASAVGGAAIDDVARLNAQLAGYTKLLEDMEKVNQGASPSAEALRAKIAELNEKLAINASLFGETAKATEDNSGAQEKATKVTLEEVKTTGTKLKQSATLKKILGDEQKALEKVRKENEKAIAQLKKNLESNEAIIEAIEFETELLGLSADAQELEREMRRLNADATDEQREALEEAVRARQKAQKAAEAETESLEENTKKQEEAAERTGQAWESIGTMFDDLVEDGELNFEKLATGFADMLTQMSKDAEGADLGFGSGDWEAAAAATAGVAAVAAADALFEAETTGAGAAIGAVVGAYYGGQWGAAAGAFLGEAAEGAFFGQDNDGNNRGSADFSLSDGTVKRNEWGEGGGGANSDFAVTLTEPLIALAEALGGSTLAGNITVGNNEGIKYDNISYGKDKTAFLAVAFRDVIQGATELDQSLKDLLIGFDGTSKHFLEFTQAILMLSENSGINSVTEAINDFDGAQRTMLVTYREQTRSLEMLVDNFDGSAEAATELSDKLIYNKQAAYDFAMAIQAIGLQIGEAAASQAQYIRESVMTEEDLRTARLRERDALRESLSSLTDPQKIEEASNKILMLNKQVFDSLAEDEQQRRSEEFANIAENTADVAQNVLNVSLDTLEASAERMNERIRVMLETAADKQARAADIALQASQNNLVASQTPLVVTVNTTTGETEVNT
jgi:uncharacterized protein YfkK (UPF0435 family)